MSKFNTVSAAYDEATTVNKCGHVAYKMDDKSKLVSQVLTSFFSEKKFYGDNSEELVDTLKKVIAKDPAFVSSLAAFARREFNMRSVSHVLTAYLAHEPAGKTYVRKTVKDIVLRGDDATELLAFYLSTFGKPIPNSLRKALRDVFVTFDSYTLAKYKGADKQVKMKDLLMLTHPAPTSDEQSASWKALLEDSLKPAYTWETELSAKGNNKETWEELIDSNRVGYMALLRNLRNIIKSGAENAQKVFDKLADKDEVLKSKQLPFRFLSAYRQLGSDWDDLQAKSALEQACSAAVENIPKIPGKTVIAIDVSGSMSSPISSRSDVRCVDIAVLLGAIANRICEQSMVFTFDTSINRFNIPKQNGILNFVSEFSHWGGGTNMFLPFDKMIDEHIECDRVIILSDNECNQEYYYSYGRNGGATVQELADKYRAEMGKDIWVHAIDLQGYGTQQFKGPKTNVIAGWSEKVFEFITLAEQGTDALVERIESYRA